MKKPDNLSPLADRCRPATLDEYVGQGHLLEKSRVVRTILETGRAFSLILWGDPGSGKTTLARLIAASCDMEAHFLSAISAGVADVRRVIEAGRRNLEEGRQTLLFLDEIHRFNKAQQDSVLGSVENGDIILIGATTENPSFNVIAPLLSRTRVLKLNRLEAPDLEAILKRVLSTDSVLLEGGARLTDEVAGILPVLANGDARRMLNILETAFFLSPDGNIGREQVDEAVRNSMLYYDRAGDRHYDTISAFIKSMRGSDPDAALYYLARMLLSGEDPEFIARRCVIFASEDVSNAVPQALPLAVAAMTAVQNIGLPEAEIILGHLVTFLSSSPKSNASYVALQKAKAAAGESNYEIPMHIRNAPTGLMKKQGYGWGYRYPHDHPGHFVEEEYLPAELAGTVFYMPSDEGNEKAVAERLKRLWPGRRR